MCTFPVRKLVAISAGPTSCKPLPTFMCACHVPINRRTNTVPLSLVQEDGAEWVPGLTRNYMLMWDNLLYSGEPGSHKRSGIRPLRVGAMIHRTPSSPNNGFLIHATNQRGISQRSAPRLQYLGSNMYSRGAAGACEGVERPHFAEL